MLSHLYLYQWWTGLGDGDQDHFKQSLDIKTRIKKTLGLQSWYRDSYQDFRDYSLDIKTGIKTFDIAVLVLWLVSRLSWLQSWYQDWYQDF